MKIQSTLEKTRLLNGKLKELQANKIVSNPQIAVYHNLLLQVKSFKAQTACLKTSLASLSHLNEDLRSKLAIMDQKKLVNNQGEEDSNSMLLQVSETTNANTTLRRYLTQYKVRINDFIQKYVMSVRGELSSLIEPLQSFVIKEGAEFLGLCDFLLEETVPAPLNQSGAEETADEGRPHPLDNKILGLVYRSLNLGLHLSHTEAERAASELRKCLESREFGEAVYETPLTLKRGGLDVRG